MSKQKFAALDFETYYSKDYSIQGSSTYQYVHHPEFDAYLVSIWSPEVSYVGRTDDFKDWKKFEGYTFIAHNASFDQRCFERCVELGIIPDVDVSWVCSADMCVYFQYQRNLKGAAKEILGVDMDKGVRSNMKGKTWDDMIATMNPKRFSSTHWTTLNTPTRFGRSFGPFGLRPKDCCPT